MTLVKGGNVELPPDVSVAGYLTVTVEATGDVDLFAVVADAAGTALSESSLVFFNNPTDPSGSVSLAGGGPGVQIRLSRMPDRAAAVHVAVGCEQPVAELHPRLRIADGAGHQVAAFPLSGLTSEATVIAVEIYRRSGGWRVRNVSQGWSQGLPALLNSFGIEVDEPDTQPAASPAPSGELPPLRDVLPKHVPPTAPRPGPPLSATPALTPAATPAPALPAAPSPTAVFCPAPGWPAPPAGWRPPPGWRPHPTWPPAPIGWQFWAVPAPPPVARPMVGSVPRQGGGLFGPRRADLQEEVARLTQIVHDVGGLDLIGVRQQIGKATEELHVLEQRLAATRAEVASAQAQLVVADDTARMQEAGFFTFTHPLDDSAAYKSRLADLRDRMKQLVRAGAAIRGAQQWTVNGSLREGTAMVRDFSKLMLRAYNAEADSQVRTVKPHTRRAAQDRLSKSRDTIARLGKTMSIHVDDRYHQLRLQEIALTAEYHAKVEEERERARAAREEQRENEKAEREFQREKEHLLRERAKYESALARADWSEGDTRLRELRDKIDSIGDAIVGIEKRAANLRAGTVYVISNIGAFGGNMVKIGLTRRLDPMDRIRELGDASVPFRFDVHALILSEDAVALERDLHRIFAERKVNAVNPRREFFYASPLEVRDALAQLGTQYLLMFTEEPEADEFRRSPSPVAANGY